MQIYDRIDYVNCLMDAQGYLGCLLMMTEAEEIDELENVHKIKFAGQKLLLAWNITSMT